MNTEVKQKLDELRIKLKQQCNSINEMAIKKVTGMLSDDVTIEVCDDGIFFKNQEVENRPAIFIKSENIPELIKVLSLFI
jgi:hypothetical protein